MNIDWNITQIFLLITGFFFVLGAPLKWRVSQIPFLCLPAIGLIIFGGIITPILYFTGGWHSYILYATVIIFMGFGLISLFLIIKSIQPTKRTLFSLVMLGLLILIITGLIVQSSKYSVSGGIDSAIHAAYISNIVQFGNFNTSYPLGMHIFILFIENISSHSTSTILLALQIFFIVNIFIVVYYAIKTISGSKTVGMIGIMAAIFDVSIYNNYLNGSITHLLAVLLMLVGILLTLILPKNNKYLHFSVIIVFYVSVFYFHFITLFMLIPVLWCLRICRTNNQHWTLALALPVSLLVVAPLLRNFLDIPGFRIQFIVACFIFLLIEVVILFFSGRLKKLLFNKWVQLLFAVIGLLAFKNTLKIFDVIPEWYGLFIIFMAIIGITLIILKRMRDWYPMAMYFSIFSTLYYFIDFASAHIESPIFKELIFYYGFTIPFILLGAAGLYYGLQLVSSKVVKASALTALLVVIILISDSRFFDKTFLRNTRMISRYGQNSGFGVFYSGDDVKTALWAKKHIPKDAGIINPGGLYNAWASLTERRALYSAYVVVNSQEPTETNQAVIDLLTNKDRGCPQQLIKQKYQYLLLPSQFVVNFFNPCVDLLYESGRARLYHINDQSINAVRSQMINLSDSTQNKEISLSGDFQIACPYCGNRFYFQFQNVARTLTIPAYGTLLITIASANIDRHINLRIGGHDSLVDATMVAPEEKKLKFSGEYLLQNYQQSKEKDILVQINNNTSNAADIQSIVFDVL